MNYKTIKNDGICEEDIKKSRFICQLKRISTEDEGRQFIAEVKKEHYKATHSCSAMIVGEDALIKRSSDDGEPSGTAGVPMLTVLEKQGLTNVVAVVTRYFGGIKLGAGGLIRAYSGSVANALKEIGIVEVKEQEGLKITLTFLEQVTTFIYLDADAVEDVSQRLIEFYQGKVTFQKEGAKIVEVDL